MPMLSGQPDAVQAAARLIDPLAPEDAELIAEIALASSVAQARRIEEQLADAGYPRLMGGKLRRQFTLPNSIGDAVKNVWEGIDGLLLAVTRLGATDGKSPDSRARAWRMPDLAALFHALNIADVDPQSLNAAITDHSYLVDATARIAARLHGIPMVAAAQQAEALSKVRTEDPDSLRLGPLLVPPAPRVPTEAKELVSVPAEDEQLLLDCLTSPSCWLAEIAANLIPRVSNDGLAERIAAALSSMPVAHRRMAAVTACEVADEPVTMAKDLLAGDDPPARAGAAAVLGLIASEPDPPPTVGDAMAAMLADPDLTVRAEASLAATESVRESAPPALHWTCEMCASPEPLDQRRCEECGQGRRPSITK